jgi:hypothetical protein
MVTLHLLFGELSCLGVCYSLAKDFNYRGGFMQNLRGTIKPGISDKPHLQNQEGLCWQGTRVKRYLFYYVIYYVNFITNSLLLTPQFCQKLNEKAKIADSLEFRNHCWRELGIGQITNDPNITDPKRSLFAHHTSASSQLADVRPGHNSDFAFQKSVSGAPMPTKKKDIFAAGGDDERVKTAKGIPKAKPRMIQKVA